jgi:hypothetical protein
MNPVTQANAYSRVLPRALEVQAIAQLHAARRALEQPGGTSALRQSWQDTVKTVEEALMRHLNPIALAFALERLAREDWEDALEEARAGLLNGIRTWKPSKDGYPLTSWCEQHAWKRVVRWDAKTLGMHASELAQNRANRLYAIKHRLEDAGESPSVETLVAEYNRTKKPKERALTEEEAIGILYLSRALSLDATLGEDSDTTLGDTLTVKPSQSEVQINVNATLLLMRRSKDGKLEWAARALEDYMDDKPVNPDELARAQAHFAAMYQDLVGINDEEPDVVAQ